MRALVTGAAGFIGSTLVAELLEDGHNVRGLDCFTSYYDRAAKEANLARVSLSANFEFNEMDLRTADLDAALDGVDVVFHLAAQPGVRKSWADGFAEYVEHNVAATQRLLEAARVHGELDRFVYASSSSVYGNATVYPSREDALLQPFSPYGVTKLAAENLCTAYAHNFGVPAVSLRYFTVYGPRQRPDMATHRLIEAALGGAPFRLFGDGRHVRDFTFVGDVVDATIRAGLNADVEPGTVCNIAGGSSTSMADLVGIVEDVSGCHLDLVILDEQPGDVVRTGGDITRANNVLGWEPKTDLRAGITAQVAWHRARRLIAA